MMAYLILLGILVTVAVAEIVFLIRMLHRH